MKTKMKKLERDRESLRKEVEELRAKKMECEKAAQLYKSRVVDLEQSMLKAKAAISQVLNADLEPKKTLKLKLKLPSSAAATTPPPPINGVSNKDVSYKVTRHCELKILNEIKKKLHKENLEKFERSCFGHLLKIHDLKYQGQLVMHLLMHMDMDASNKERLVFKINNNDLEFGPSDFSIITGLRHGKLAAAATTTSSIHNDVFKGRPTILLKHIKMAFRTVCRADEGRGDLALKLSLLYVLYGALLHGNQLKKIELRYLHLVEDLLKFNEFPWGQVAYEFLASFMLSARSRLAGSKVIYLNVHGFSSALQIWAYEVMPSVAAYCADRVDKWESLTPRILRWSALNKLIRFKDLEKFFSMDDKESHLVLNGIKASPWELEELSTNTIPQPKDRMCDAAMPTSSANSPMQHLTTESKARVVKRVEGRCSTSAAGDVIIISDSDSDSDDDDGIPKTPSAARQKKKRKRSEEEREAASNSQSTDSDNESCSSTYMNNYIAMLQTRTARK